MKLYFFLRSYVYFDIKYGLKFGRLVFELYSDLLPDTCRRFMSLCLYHPMKQKSVSYFCSPIHRIAKCGWLQGGKINDYHCIWPDESYAVSHDRRGVLSLCNSGKHSNGSQFFITLAPSRWMDGYYVAFGQLIEGYKILQDLEFSVASYEQTDLKTVIKGCGVLPYGRGVEVRNDFICQLVQLIGDEWEEFVSSVSEKKEKGSAISINYDLFHIQNQDQEVDSNVHNLIESVIQDTSPRAVEQTLERHLMTLLLDMVMQIINAHNVQEDAIDTRDAESDTLLLERYLKNLYSLTTADECLKELLDLSLQSNYIQQATDIKLDLIEKNVLTTNVYELIKRLSEEHKDEIKKKFKWSFKDYEMLSKEITKEIRKELSKFIKNLIFETFSLTRKVNIDSYIHKEKRSLNRDKIKEKITELTSGLRSVDDLSHIKDNSIHVVTWHLVKSVLDEGLKIYARIVKEKVKVYDITKKAYFKTTKHRKNLKVHTKK